MGERPADSPADNTHSGKEFPAVAKKWIDRLRDWGRKAPRFRGDYSSGINYRDQTPRWREPDSKRRSLLPISTTIIRRAWADIDVRAQGGSSDIGQKPPAARSPTRLLLIVKISLGAGPLQHGNVGNRVAVPNHDDRRCLRRARARCRRQAERGAVNASRGMLEFRADPESPYYNPVFQKNKTPDLLRVGWPRRVERQEPEGSRLPIGLQRRRLQGTGRRRLTDAADVIQPSMTAIASISTIASGSARRLIWTVVLVGVAGPK
jgi:hypothetical protein